MPADPMDDPRYVCQWWITYPNGTRKLSNASLTRAQAEAKWPGRCEPDLSSRTLLGGYTHEGGHLKPPQP